MSFVSCIRTLKGRSLLVAGPSFPLRIILFSNKAIVCISNYKSLQPEPELDLNFIQLSPKDKFRDGEYTEVNIGRKIFRNGRIIHSLSLCESSGPGALSLFTKGRKLKIARQ